MRDISTVPHWTIWLRFSFKLTFGSTSDYFTYSILVLFKRSIPLRLFLKCCSPSSCLLEACISHRDVTFLLYAYSTCLFYFMLHILCRQHAKINGGVFNKHLLTSSRIRTCWRDQQSFTKLVLQVLGQVPKCKYLLHIVHTIENFHRTAFVISAFL
jgi:hypothetical protein